MLERVRSHPYLLLYLSYTASQFAYGTNNTALGPLIPYLSAQTHRPQTQYSFLFSCRSFGMLVGAISLKLMQKNTKITLHQYIIVASLAILVFNVLFTLSPSTFFQGLWMFVASIFLAIRAIAVNTSVILVNPHEDMEFYVLLTHGTLGVGGLIGPFLVYLLETKALIVSGCIFALVSLNFFRLPSPQQGTITKNEERGEARKDVPWQVEWALVLFLFFYIGMEYDYAGWISSYATITGVSTKEGATVFPLIYWVVMTFSRFGCSMLAGSSSQKMGWALLSTVLFGVLSLLLIAASWVELACYSSAVLFGVSMASLYPLAFSIGSEFGWQLNEHQTNNIITGGVLGEGVLTMSAGKLMQWFSPNLLFGFIIAMALAMWLCRGVCISYLSAEYNKQKTDIQQELVQMNSSQ